jgi:DNA-binding NarL/FixJ family response regulator
MLDKADAWRAGSIGDRPLTRREFEIARLVSEGLANKVVAGQLGVQEGTVKIHLHNIYRKLGISNRAELILNMLANRRT